MDITIIEPRWTWCAAHGLRHRHSIVVGADGAILDVTPEPVTREARRIAVPEGLALPGLINLHNHALSAPLFRGWPTTSPRVTSRGTSSSPC
jgi:cytosine/adenosine deaminase-related metal-dependent hydrolase